MAPIGGENIWGNEVNSQLSKFMCWKQEREKSYFDKGQIVIWEGGLRLACLVQSHRRDTLPQMAEKIMLACQYTVI